VNMRGAVLRLIGGTLVVVAAATAASAASPDGSAVIVKTVAEDAIHAELLALSVEGGAVLRTQDGGERRVPTRDLVRITSETVTKTTTKTPRAPQHSELTLMLAGGDVLTGRPIASQAEGPSAEAGGSHLQAGGSDVVVVDADDLGVVAVPLDLIEQVTTPHASKPAYGASAAWFGRGRAAAGDRLLLTNGDLVSGFVASIDAAGVQITTESGQRDVPYRLLVAARLAASRPRPIDRPHFVVEFKSSGRLTLAELDWSGKTVTVKPWQTREVQLDAERIVRIDVAGGRWEWLSRQEPISYQHTPMLALGWQHVNDRNVLGEPLTVAGQVFEHGVGVHSHARLTYDLKGAYRQFVTSFGIDDHSGAYADVSVAILVDGHRRFDQADVRPGKLWGPIRIDVAQAGRLELIVDFGKNGDLQDRFNWVESALIRE